MLKCDSVIWKPTPEIVQSSYVSSLMKRFEVKTSEELWKKSVADIGLFWDVVMQDLGIEWFKNYDKVLDSSQGIEWTRWFLGGRINIAHNCVDRHQGQGTKPAILWEGESGEQRQLSYIEFYKLVNQTANALKELDTRKGDCVGILMPMVPEVVAQLFACFKIGAIAIPIFSGFGKDAIRQRLLEAEAKVLFTSDISLRRGKKLEVKQVADQACEGVPSLKAKIVFRRGDGPCPWNSKVDHWWHEFVLKQPQACVTESLEAESNCMIIFTSGTTGKPKGTIHTHAGAMAMVGKELRYAFNTDASSRFFWLTDIGWMMGPWEMIGVTLFGGTLFLYEGAPDYPSPSRLWQIIDRYQISVLGISPTAIRLLMRYGEQPLAAHSLASLRLLGSTGEPWDPESYRWFFKNVGKERCPIINISGGTEILGCLLSPLPIQPLKPCSLGGPALGVDADVFDDNGKPVRGGIGHLVCKQPIPSMTKGFLKGRDRYLQTYFSRWKGVWYHGDWAQIDEDGHWFLHGRSDDTIKIGGKRVGPAEFEASLLDHPKVSEAAAIGVPDPLKGESCVCFVVLKPNSLPSELLREELKNHVIQMMGKAFAPKVIKFVSMLPKTRSSKILRSLIRKIFLSEPLSDTASVDNPAALEAIAKST